MSIIDVYGRAYERHEMEKEAEAIIGAYGTAEGYLPEAYFGAFVEMEKEAHVEIMVNTFAPETGYIPARYVNALEKEASVLAAISKGAKGVGSALTKKVQKGGIGGPNFGLSRMKGSGGLNVKAFGKNIGVSNTALGAGVAGAGALGAAGTGYGVSRMMGGGGK